jgi:hypothetical protein
MLEVQAVEAELLKDPTATILQEFGEFGWIVEVRIGDFPIPARIAVSGGVSEEFVMFWTPIGSDTVAEAFEACAGISNVGIARDAEGSFEFRAAILKRNSLPSAVPNSLRTIAAAWLRYQASQLLSDEEAKEPIDSEGEST